MYMFAGMDTHENTGNKILRALDIYLLLHTSGLCLHPAATLESTMLVSNKISRMEVVRMTQTLIGTLGRELRRMRVLGTMHPEQCCIRWLVLSSCIELG